MSKSETPATRAAQAKWTKENYARIVQARVKVARLGLTDLAHGAAYEVPESLVTAYQRGQVAGAFVAPERITVLEAALAFYANSANWQSPSSGFEAQYDPKPSAVSADRGARACAVLATPEGEG